MNHETSARLELAESFLALRASPPFRSILDFLRREVEAAKGAVILGDANLPTKEIRRRIIAWQEREKVLIAIESIFDEHQMAKDSIIEGEADERRIAAERASRAGW